MMVFRIAGGFEAKFSIFKVLTPTGPKKYLAEIWSKFHLQPKMVVCVNLVQ